jgi:hypothetical protein
MRRTSYSTLVLAHSRSVRIGLAALAALGLAACASNSARFSPMPGKSFPAKDDSFEVAVFESLLPARPFERIARIDVRMKMPASEDASLKDAMAELKRQARLAGADAVIDIRLQRSKGRDATRFQVSAMGIRYSPN